MKLKRQSIQLLFIVFTAVMLLIQGTPVAGAAEIVKAQKINPTAVELVMADEQRITLDFYGENVFRLFCDPAGGMLRAPQCNPPAEILTSHPRRTVSMVEVTDEKGAICLRTAEIEMVWDKKSTLFSLFDRNRPGEAVVRQKLPILFDKENGKTVLVLQERADEYFYGGGVQNGRFSHKGHSIAIENQNSWTDGGVASPAPFYWSTGGYGFMAYTFAKGVYDFGAAENGTVTLSHQTDYADFFFMVSSTPAALLSDYYQLTGKPVLLPKFGFYEGHLNAYNRDFWKESDRPDKGVLFEDGKRYVESQKDKTGTQESLNGEKKNYQFSARAVIDRYRLHDMPLGWLLPNDGYSAGYGQTGTLDGNIQNLKEFTEYAQSRGVQVGLWTQSDLHPKEGVEALLQRDLIKEVRDAGVRVLKTDVAWVGSGYSFGLNGITDAAAIMSYYGADCRPFIITLDGWAGTQRYGAIWTGDQVGGLWEYIRFHIPTYIGSGLSGEPNIASDMDGIFGGKNALVNMRDFQWKTFTPMQLNMDGWGDNEKYPHALGEPATSVNRWYLKLKSELMPYTYSIARQAMDGKPMIRAMFLEFPNAYTYGKATEYQYMYGPDFLVAPVYQETQADEQGNDLRNGIYLPEGRWIDYFTGESHTGGRILNNVKTPYWKLPLYVKSGAIIPLNRPHNQPMEVEDDLRIYELYPDTEKSGFTEYDDDGVTQEYLTGASVTTLIESQIDEKGELTVTIHPTEGNYRGFVKEKSTELRINLTEPPKRVTAKAGKKKIALKEAADLQEFERGENVYYYETAPQLNRFATAGSEFAKVSVVKNPLLFVKTGKNDITAQPLTVRVSGCRFAHTNRLTGRTGSLAVPQQAGVTQESVGAYTLKPTWDRVENADYYEIEFGGMCYSTITQTELLFTDLKPQTEYTFKLRAVNNEGCSDWNSFTASTRSDPLESAIRGVRGQTDVRNQGGQGVNCLFNFDENDIWHTLWQTVAVPFELTIDMQTVNTLDKFHYLPRERGNGILQKGEVFHSMDKEQWKTAGTFEWAADGETKIFTFAEQPTARYLKIAVSEAVGGFGSGRELYLFKVPGTASYLQGDANNDGKIDRNDYTSYMNYTGLRRGDADFEGYISRADVNGNGLIDAYDISLVATRIDGKAKPDTAGPVQGELKLRVSRNYHRAGDTIRITVQGVDLRSVNALSMVLPYSAGEYVYAGMELLDTKQMENLTYDRLHKGGERVLYPTLINTGNKESLNKTSDLFVLKFVARGEGRFCIKADEVFLVDKMLNTRHISDSQLKK